MRALPPGRPPAAGLRYTRIVVAFGRTLTSLALVTALAGSPALLSACLVACLPAAAGAATPAASPDAASLAAAHAHHGGAEVPSAAVGTATPGSTEDAGLDGECHDCCASAADALDGGMAGERPAAVAVSLAPGASPDHLALVTLTHVRRRLPPLVPPPAPVRASLVLRI